MPKKPTKGKATKNKPVAMPESSRKSVNITKASNGFVVSSYTDKGEKTMIAKTKAEAKKHADKLLGL
jgi:hypothetical protein